MRNTFIVSRMFLTITSPTFLIAEKPPAIDPRVAEVSGPLPKRGKLADILACSGANEVAWITLMKESPRRRPTKPSARLGSMQPLPSTCLSQIHSR